MRFLRAVLLSIGLMALAGACGGGNKGANEPTPPPGDDKAGDDTKTDDTAPGDDKAGDDTKGDDGGGDEAPPADEGGGDAP
ncbi:MAG TPA: hypothetical protein VL172_02660 [Kofleriaceae bacterium]|nr:hypothetical protein [Kofleriaceae bacterium]